MSSKVSEDILRVYNTLRLETYPVGVKLCRNEIPANVRRPSKLLGYKITLCQAFGMTRRYGWTMGVSSEECKCSVARVLFGWSELRDIEDMADLFYDVGFFKDKDTARRGSSFTVNNCMLKHGEVKGIVTTPMTRLRVEPDVVLFYCNPSQAFIMIHGYLYNVGGALNVQYTGRHASCGHGVIQTLKIGTPNLVLPDEGDKLFSMCEDYEVIYAVPVGLIEDIVKGVEAIVKKGTIRYPTPFYLRFQPEFPEPFSRFTERTGS